MKLVQQCKLRLFDDSLISCNKVFCRSSFQKKFELINVESQYLPYLTTNKTRYVEMFVSTAPGLVCTVFVMKKKFKAYLGYRY